MKNAPIGPFVGINNRVPAHQLELVERGRKTGDYLRNAVNVDLTASGTLQRRRGAELVTAGADIHSLWAGETGAFFVDGDSLFAFPGTFVRSGLVPGQRVSYDEDALGGVVWSNGTLIERISGATSSPLTPTTPNPAPAFTAAAGGGLPAGKYTLAVVAVGVDGIESAPTWPVQLDVLEGSRIEVSGLVGDTRIYASAQNGTTLYLAASTSAAVATISMPVDTAGPQLLSVGLSPMPAGHIVRIFNGRLLVASGQTLFISEPYSFLYNPIRGFIPFPGRITVCEPCEDGVYVAADQTYWLAGGDPVNATPETVFPYGATEGTGGRNPDNKTVFWFSDKGVVSGAPGGQAANVQEPAVAVGAAGFGAMGYRDQNGLRQLVASVFGTQATKAEASSFADAEVIRKESML